MPKFENGKVKNFLGITAGGGIVGKHLLDSRFVEIAASHGFGIKKKVVDPVPEFAAKPSFVWNREASFFALQNFAWYAIAQSFLGDVLGSKAVDLEVLRQGSSEFENFVIEQRDTEFDGIGHGHFVGF